MLPAAREMKKEIPDYRKRRTMLTREQLLGLWVSVPTEWDEDGNFDEKSFRTEVAMLIETGVHGLYTTGSTGEFYALDWEEWKQVQDAFLAETVGRIPVQVGANWFNTRDTIKRMRYARDKGADAVQICFPGWMEMRQEDYDQFLIDCCAAVTSHHSCANRYWGLGIGPRRQMRCANKRDPPTMIGVSRTSLFQMDRKLVPVSSHCR